ncbi:MAG: oligosaccharide flippase family protein [Burkholderiales bacterium]
MSSTGRGLGVRRLVSSEFVRQVAETYLTQLSVVALGVVNSVLVTRILGPEGRGLFAVANTLSATGIQLGNLGLQSSNTYYVARDPSKLPVLLGNSLVVSAATGLVALLAFPLLWLRPEAMPIGGTLLALTLLAVPAGLASLLLQNLLIGTQQIRAYNTIDLTTRVLAVLLVAATAPLGLVSPEVVFGLVLATVVLGALWCLLRFRSQIQGPLAWSFETLRACLPYGLRAYAGSLFVFLVLRSDIVIVTYLRGAVETGYYAIAVGLADLLLMLPTVIGTILFPKLSAIPEQAARWQVVRRVLSSMVPATPAALVLVYVAAGPLIRLAYGPAFVPSTAAVGWLLPGVGCYAINGILMNFLASCGMPLVVVYSPFVALLVNVSINLWLVPRMGFVGASISSSVAYGLMLLMSVLYIRFRLFRAPHD